MGEPIPDFMVEVDALKLPPKQRLGLEMAARRLYNATLQESMTHLKRHVDIALASNPDPSLQKLSDVAQEVAVKGDFDIGVVIASVEEVKP